MVRARRQHLIMIHDNKLPHHVGTHLMYNCGGHPCCTCRKSCSRSVLRQRCTTPKSSEEGKPRISQRGRWRQAVIQHTGMGRSMQSVRFLFVSSSVQHTPSQSVHSSTLIALSLGTVSQCLRWNMHWKDRGVLGCD